VTIGKAELATVGNVGVGEMGVVTTCGERMGSEVLFGSLASIFFCVTLAVSDDACLKNARKPKTTTSPQRTPTSGKTHLDDCDITTGWDCAFCGRAMYCVGISPDDMKLSEPATSRVPSLRQKSLSSLNI
jgi:hypothetical protein